MHTTNLCVYFWAWIREMIRVVLENLWIYNYL